LAQNAVVINNITFTNPNADRDWDINTGASANVPSNTVARVYDFGSILDLYIYVDCNSNGIRIEYSSDNSSWTILTTVSSGRVASVFKITARYLRFNNPFGVTYPLTIHELIAFTDNTNTRVNDFTINNWFKHVLSGDTEINYLIVFDPVTASTLSYSLNRSDVRETIRDIMVI
jgi:hypothetical protein